MNRILFLILSLLLSASGSGQTLINNGKIIQILGYQKNKLYNWYFGSVTAPNEFINGKEYLPYYVHSNTTPLLFSGEMLNTTIKTGNREYKNISLQYDTYMDELVYTDTSRFIDYIYPRIALNKDIISEFDLIIRTDTLHFRNIKFPDITEYNMIDGFYEIAYEGETEFIIRHHSEIYNHNALNEYSYSPKKYIRTGGRYVEFRNIKSLIPIFEDWSAEINEFLKKSGIRTRKADKSEIIKFLVYVDSLKRSKTGL